MEIDVKKIIRNENAAFPLAYALVEVDGKMKLWFIVAKNKSGYPYCIPLNARIEREWRPVFELSDNVKHKTFCNKVLNEIMKKEQF